MYLYVQMQASQLLPACGCIKWIELDPSPHPQKTKAQCFACGKSHVIFTARPRVCHDGAYRMRANARPSSSSLGAKGLSLDHELHRRKPSPVGGIASGLAVREVDRGVGTCIFGFAITLGLTTYIFGVG